MSVLENRIGSIKFVNLVRSLAAPYPRACVVAVRNSTRSDQPSTDGQFVSNPRGPPHLAPSLHEAHNLPMAPPEHERSFQIPLYIQRLPPSPDSSNIHG